MTTSLNDARQTLVDLKVQLSKETNPTTQAALRTQIRNQRSTVFSLGSLALINVGTSGLTPTAVTDSMPSMSSAYLVQSGGVHTALGTKQNTLNASNSATVGIVTSATARTGTLTVSGNATFTSPLSLASVSGSGVGTVIENGSTKPLGGAAALTSALAAKQDSLQNVTSPLSVGVLTSTSRHTPGTFTASGTSTFTGPVVLNGTLSGSAIATTVEDAANKLLTTAAAKTALDTKQGTMSTTGRNVTVGILTSTSFRTGVTTVSNTANFLGDLVLDGAVAGASVSATPVQSSAALVTSGGVHSALALKQDALSSTSNVSLGIVTSTTGQAQSFQATGTATFSGPAVFHGTLTGPGIATTITSESSSLVTSGAAFSALATKQNVLSSASNILVQTLTTASFTSSTALTATGTATLSGPVVLDGTLSGSGITSTVSGVSSSLVTSGGVFALGTTKQDVLTASTPLGVGTLTVAGNVALRSALITPGTKGPSAATDMVTYGTASSATLYGNVAFTSNAQDGYILRDSSDASANAYTAFGTLTGPWTSSATYNPSYTGQTAKVIHAGGGNASSSAETMAWKTRANSATQNVNYRAVAYGQGLLVALASTGERMTCRDDGTKWEIRTGTLSSSSDWRALAFGNGKFVAVGAGASDATAVSSDGLTWSSNSAPSDADWSSVTYGNGFFVAVGSAVSVESDQRIMRSADGVTWTLYAAPAGTGPLTSVTFGKGLFVAVATSGTGNRVLTSPDGMTWTSRTSAADNTWQSVTYGNGVFVAVSDSGTGNRVMTSPDGLAWTIRTSASDNSWWAVAYGDGMFVAVSESDKVMVSTDNGATWSLKQGAGTPWTGSSLTTAWRALVYGGNQTWAAVGSLGRIMTHHRKFSNAHASTWTLRTSPVADGATMWLSVLWGNDKFVATGNNNIMTSPDGKTWTSRSTVTGRWESVAYGNNIWVAVSADSANIQTSPNGITWTTRAHGTTRASSTASSYNSIVYANGIFMAVGNGGAAMSSTDGITWTNLYNYHA